MSFLSFFFIVVGVPFLLSLIIAGAAVWFKEPDDAYDDHEKFLVTFWVMFLSIIILVLMLTCIIGECATSENSETAKHSACCTCENCAAKPEEPEVPAGYILLYDKYGNAHVIKPNSITEILPVTTGTTIITTSAGDSFRTEESYDYVVTLINTAATDNCERNGGESL